MLIEKDPFTQAEQQIEEAGPFGHNFNVRRPLLGMTVKDPRFAYISLYQDLGEGSQAQAISLIDSSAPGGYSNANHNFILRSVVEQRSEKAQIVETFGDHFVFFYGQKPIVLQVSGVLFNTDDFNWKNEFLANYDRFLRGTRCVENKTRVFLGWDDVLAQGYLLNIGISMNDEMPNVVPFNFTFLLSKPPVDLSNAAAPLDNPNPASDRPYQYRSYALAESNNAVNETLREAADISIADQYPEYVNSEVGGYEQVKKSDLVTIGVDGRAVVVSGSNENVPGDQESPNGSAYWVTGPNPRSKQWRSRDEALFALNATLTAQQTGADPVTTVQALRRDAASFQLARRDAAALTILRSLGTGVANSAAVVPDAPDVE